MQKLMFSSNSYEYNICKKNRIMSLKVYSWPRKQQLDKYFSTQAPTYLLFMKLSTTSRGLPQQMELISEMWFLKKKKTSETTSKLDLE